MNQDIYIGSFKRLVIYIIDVLIIGLLLYLIFGDSDSDRIQIIQLILFFGYFALMVYYFRATLGQKIFKLKTVDSITGQTPSIRALLLRELASLTAWTGIGFIIAQFTHSYNSGFYWDRWTKIKVIPSEVNLPDFDKQIEVDRKRLFPDA